METSTFWLLIALPWSALGMAVGLLMGRAGHNLAVWVALGIAWGPFSVPLAVGAHRRERGERRRVLDEGRPYDGPVDLLIGTDGSPESLAALERATAILGPRIGRLRVVEVVDRDTGSADDRPELEPRIVRLKAIVAQHLPDLRPEVIITTGVPARRLAEMATEEGFDLIAVGARGRGLSDALLGSTAETLVHSSAVPVVVVHPDGARDPRHRTLGATAEALPSRPETRL